MGDLYDQTGLDRIALCVMFLSVRLDGRCLDLILHSSFFRPPKALKLGSCRIV